MQRRPTTYSPPPTALPPQRKPPVVEAAIVTAVLVGGVWLQELIDLFGFGGQLDYYGIQPRDPQTFWHIFTAPFLHAGLPHLIANTLPLAVLAFMSALRSIGRFLGATFVIMLVGGTLVWLFGRSSTHLGASELIFGYLAYLLGVGWWERTPSAIAIALVALFLYGGIIWGVLPSNPMVSWEAHLFGFIGGLVAALLLHGRRRVRGG
ncbi:hypothetical protein Dxin01_01612 [Deinococcus xinjiangensis]|uniref:Peptidase S54 rhomboid domain-containing protein n=1 Tax=Deinococcus xinjiangensis TaxID=457454 RepID=A0ABP9VCT8_9DEIO